MWTWNAKFPVHNAFSLVTLVLRYPGSRVYWRCGSGAGRILQLLPNKWESDREFVFGNSHLVGVRYGSWKTRWLFSDTYKAKTKIRISLKELSSKTHNKELLSIYSEKVATTFIVMMNKDLNHWHQVVYRGCDEDKHPCKGRRASAVPRGCVGLAESALSAFPHPKNTQSSCFSPSLFIWLHYF